MIHDWDFDFALFEAAYPGTDWRKLTYAVFVARLGKAQAVNMAMSLGIPDDLKRKVEVQRLNRMLLLQERFPSIYPPLNFDED